MRKTVLYIAISVDGYLARTDGAVDWLAGQEPEAGTETGYHDFLQGVDTVLMGWNTYRQIAEDLSPDEWPYQGLEAYIVTHRKISSQPGIHFTRKTPVELVHELRKKEGRDIWICGGADIVRQLLETDQIDRFFLSVIPVILGKGIPLFPKGEKSLWLRLQETRTENGIVELIYQRES